jgi:hypothetical protein
MQKTTPLETLDIIMVSAKLQKYGYVDGITKMLNLKNQITIKKPLTNFSRYLLR